MKKFLALAICGLGLLALGSTAQAEPITGEIHFAGLWAPSPAGSGTATATGIDFSGAASTYVILAGTDDYFGLSGTGLAFQSFTFAPFVGSVNPLWSFSSGLRDYSFELTEVALASPPTASQLNLTGKGILRISGGGTSFDPTEGDWDFTGNAGRTLFSFSADNVAVPEPTTIGMLALGLAGLTAAGRKRTRRIA